MKSTRIVCEVVSKKHKPTVITALVSHVPQKPRVIRVSVRRVPPIKVPTLKATTAPKQPRADADTFRPLDRYNATLSEG